MGGVAGMYEGEHGGPLHLQPAKLAKEDRCREGPLTLFFERVYSCGARMFMVCMHTVQCPSGPWLSELGNFEGPFLGL